MRLILAAVFAALALLPTVANAEGPPDPWSGGCAVCSERDPATNACRVCKVSYHLSVQMPVAACSSVRGCSAGTAADVSLGACYGLTAYPEKWYASGLDFCPLITVASKDSAKREGAALMLHATPSLAFGGGPVKVDGGGFDWIFFFAPRLPLQ